MAAHSGILAWRILWTEEPGRLHGAAKSQTRLSTKAYLVWSECNLLCFLLIFFECLSMCLFLLLDFEFHTPYRMCINHDFSMA